MGAGHRDIAHTAGLDALQGQFPVTGRVHAGCCNHNAAGACMGSLRRLLHDADMCSSGLDDHRGRSRVASRTSVRYTRERDNVLSGDPLVHNGTIRV